VSPALLSLHVRAPEPVSSGMVSLHVRAPEPVSSGMVPLHVRARSVPHGRASLHVRVSRRTAQGSSHAVDHVRRTETRAASTLHVQELPDTNLGHAMLHVQEQPQ